MAERTKGRALNRAEMTEAATTLFPLLSTADLADLATDIADRGLLQPIVVDTEGTLLDGRNRLAACQQAGVEPTFTTYDGDDPAGYALSVNIARRHLTKGQQAMVAALACLETKQSQRSMANGVSAPGIAKAMVAAQAGRVSCGKTALRAATEEDFCVFANEHRRDAAKDRAGELVNAEADHG